MHIKHSRKAVQTWLLLELVVTSNIILYILRSAQLIQWQNILSFFFCFCGMFH